MYFQRSLRRQEQGVIVILLIIIATQAVIPAWHWRDILKTSAQKENKNGVYLPWSTYTNPWVEILIKRIEK